MGITELEDLQTIVKERLLAEEHYANKLSSISKIRPKAGEDATTLLAQICSSLRRETATIAESHRNMALNLGRLLRALQVFLDENRKLSGMKKEGIDNAAKRVERYKTDVEVSRKEAEAKWAVALVEEKKHDQELAVSGNSNADEVLQTMDVMITVGEQGFTAHEFNNFLTKMQQEIASQFMKAVESAQRQRLILAKEVLSNYITFEKAVLPAISSSCERVEVFLETLSPDREVQMMAERDRTGNARIPPILYWPQYPVHLFPVPTKKFSPMTQTTSPAKRATTPGIQAAIEQVFGIPLEEASAAAGRRIESQLTAHDKHPARLIRDLLSSHPELFTPTPGPRRQSTSDSLEKPRRDSTSGNGTTSNLPPHLSVSSLRLGSLGSIDAEDGNDFDDIDTDEDEELEVLTRTALSPSAVVDSLVKKTPSIPNMAEAAGMGTPTLRKAMSLASLPRSSSITTDVSPIVNSVVEIVPRMATPTRMDSSSSSAAGSPSTRPRPDVPGLVTENLSTPVSSLRETVSPRALADLDALDEDVDAILAAAEKGKF
ncbi:hypothetical protein HDU96_007298 [Phlyctochytrium bullatum]|nr:hypothetical protein HDU96_007298 [Phlyctochytrium bullatum]